MQISLWQDILMSGEGKIISMGLYSQYYFKCMANNYSQEHSFKIETCSRVRQLKILNAAIVSNYISGERNEEATLRL